MSETTNAERLERLKQHKSATDYLISGTAIKGDWIWLIEQAERVRELEKPQLTKFIMSKQQKEIKRLREALEFYADNKNYEVNVVDQWGPEIKVMMDAGAKAAELLETLK